MITLNAGDSIYNPLLLPHGYLRFYNNSYSNVHCHIPELGHNHDITVLNHTPYIYTFEVPGSIDGAVTTNVNVRSSGKYLLYTHSQYTIPVDVTTEINLEPTAGCIAIKNESTSLDITQVYVSPTASLSWGTAVNYSYVAPGDTLFCTKAPGNYDLKIYDSEDNVYLVENKAVNLNEDTYVNFNEGISVHSKQNRLISSKDM